MQQTKQFEHRSAPKMYSESEIRLMHQKRAMQSNIIHHHQHHNQAGMNSDRSSSSTAPKNNYNISSNLSDVHHLESSYEGIRNHYIIPMSNSNNPRNNKGSLSSGSARSSDASVIDSHISVHGVHKMPANIKPMPGNDEVDRRFAQVLASMDLPADKAKALKGYSAEKKWELVCDQERVQQPDPPSTYLNKLRALIDPKSTKSTAKRFLRSFKSKTINYVDGVANGERAGIVMPKINSTQVLRDLEISLRTNNIEWVREFLSGGNQGLEVLVEYLACRLAVMYRRNECAANNKRQNNDNLRVDYTSTDTGYTGDASCHSERKIGKADSLGRSSNSSSGASSGGPVFANNSYNIRNGLSYNTGKSEWSFENKTGDKNPRTAVSGKKGNKKNSGMGPPHDDVHVCIMCFRAIMNNKFGFNMVISHHEAINLIALSLTHKSLRTKGLVLELLAAICLVRGGHSQILQAFDHFMLVCKEKRRFETLMHYFKNYEEFNIEFMIACMQFINIIVHSVEDMNFRVFLQYEFTMLGLDDYLQKLKYTESEELRVQIQAYTENVFDIGSLMEEVEQKSELNETLEKLEDELSRANERLVQTENDALSKICAMETELTDLRSDRDTWKEKLTKADTELSTLRRTVRQTNDGRKVFGSGVGAASTAAPPPPPPPPPPPMSSSRISNNSVDSGTSITPPPVASGGGFAKGMVIAPPPMPGKAPSVQTIKRRVNTKYKLPVLNWVALKPAQVKGTVFCDMDDDKIINALDFTEFEELFKTSNQRIVLDSPDGGAGGSKNAGGGSSNFAGASRRFKRAEKESILEPNRLRNSAILLRNIEMAVETVVQALNEFDPKQLNADYVDILMRLMPTEAEARKYREYRVAQKPLDVLTDEDKFLLKLVTTCERLGQKLQVMNLMHTFNECVQQLTPQLQAVTTASRGVRKSERFKKVLELILAFGNYLNSSRRGPAYGFKLSSLEALLDLKSMDKKFNLMQYLAKVVATHYSTLSSFDTDLSFIEKAAEVSMENVLTDVCELERTMKLARYEYENRTRELPALHAFVEENEAHLTRLLREKKIAQDTFADLAEYFGESSRTAQPASFFSHLVRFSKAYRGAMEAYEEKHRRSIVMSHSSNSIASGNKAPASRRSNNNNSNSVILEDSVLENSKSNEAAVISELKMRGNGKKRDAALTDSIYIDPDAVEHGTLEDILLGLKQEPYRRSDNNRRSLRSATHRSISNDHISALTSTQRESCGNSNALAVSMSSAQAGQMAQKPAAHRPRAVISREVIVDI